MDYHKLLLEHLELVDRVVQFIARRHRLSASDGEEFTSIVHFKLIDKNFAILRKFQGRSNLATYLTTVVERLYLDFCISRWGKWRPSAAARRLGAVAVHLERLVVRDGLTFDEAVGTLQTNYDVSETRAELHALLLQIPLRPVRRPAGEEELTAAASREVANDAGFERADDLQLVERVEKVLAGAVARLPDRDQLLLKLHYLDERPVTQIARGLAEEPKPLYRKMIQIISGLKEELEQKGIDQSIVGRIVGHPALSMASIFSRPPGKPEDTVGMRPSNRSKKDGDG